MFIPNTIKQFIQWIQTFDSRTLQNETDVERKLVLPMFQYLGYSEIFRQSKYPLKTHNYEHQAKNLKPFHIYFSTDDMVHQNAETSLFIVICLEPNITNFADAIAQGKFYSNHLKLLFFIVTNGYEINVFKCLNYRQEEIIFDINTDLLININLASKFYNQLHFEYIKSIDKNQNFSYIKYFAIEKSLEQHSNLQEIISKSDFEPTKIREGDRLIIVRPKVLVECNLPKAFSEGNCQIQFSNLTLRGLKINLNHQDILSQLMTGLHTQARWGCRRFLHQLDNHTFEVYLGQTTVILSAIETADLCLCIDAICQDYKKLVIGLENILETWEFPLIDIAGIRGFQLFSVDTKIWELMRKFAQEFNYAQGKSEWHIFHQEATSIRISRGIRDHAFILPKIDNHCSKVEKINIVYEINEVHLQSLERGKITSWQQDIGPQGTWTAKYTQQWLLEKYIPYVIDYYSQKCQLWEFELSKNIGNDPVHITSISKINEIKELIPYLRDIQSWLNIYVENIPAVILQKYYQSFTDLVLNTDSAIIGIDYITGNLRKIEWVNNKDDIASDLIDGEHLTFKEAMHSLSRQVARINNSTHENSWKADLMTRIFIWIIEHGKIRFSQSQLNATKQALLPLWEESRFEMRYVYGRNF
ncbi:MULTISPECIES: type I restriction enzyme HsdR N-terminal domain-containing protein [unclassified Anabaena]|uniref:type I restriction enzyme HsdR N-terminal domain-containing protein n=1 Tax=unclassified Anabaena TaxID=2619674 RepID=UPI0039C7359A